MKLIYLLVAAFFLGAVSVSAADRSAQIRQTDSLPFDEFLAGQGPGRGMVCVWGECLDGRRITPAKQSRLPLASYQQLFPPTSFRGVEILPPTYGYYDGRLFMVRFALPCAEAEALSCIDRVTEVLDVEIENQAFIDLGTDKANMFLTGEIGTGALVEVLWSRREGRWNDPIVKIYHRELIEEVRLAANPNYVPMN